MPEVVIVHTDPLFADVLARALVVLGTPARSGRLSDVRPQDVLVCESVSRTREDVGLDVRDLGELQDVHALFAAVGRSQGRHSRTSGSDGTAPGDRMSTLTRREREVLGLVGAGAPNDAIAAALGISQHTVRKHMQNLMGKLDVESRHAAGAVARRHGVVHGGAA